MDKNYYKVEGIIYGSFYAFDFIDWDEHEQDYEHEYFKGFFINVPKNLSERIGSWVNSPLYNYNAYSLLFCCI